MTEMRRPAPTLLAVVALLVAGVAPATAVGLSATGVDAPSVAGAPPAPAANATADGTGSANATAATNVSPGTRLSGVLGARRAELQGEVENRSFGLQVARARRSSQTASARVVGHHVDRVETRLADLRRERDRLEAAHEAGNVSDAVYRARVTTLVIRIDQTRELLDRADREVADIPAATRERAGVNATRIRRLRDHADELTGPEIAEMAREMAGRDRDGPDRRGGRGGPPENGAPENERGGNARGGDGHAGPTHRPTVTTTVGESMPTTDRTGVDVTTSAVGGDQSVDDAPVENATTSTGLADD